MTIPTPELRRPCGVGAAGAGSGLSGISASLENSAGAADDVAPALSQRHYAYAPCGKPLVMGRREGPKKFAARHHCDRRCCNKHGFAKAAGLDHWPPTRAELEAMLAKNLSTNQMADRLHCSHATIIKLRKRYGLGAAHPVGRLKFGKPQNPTWNWRDMSKPKRTNGKFESVEEWLAAGNEPTRCPDAYAAPVISGSPFFSNGRRPG